MKFLIIHFGSESFTLPLPPYLDSMTLFKLFRNIAILEGISYLLFGITMPLKYFYEIPEPNFWVGMIHGFLFIAYCLLGLTCAIQLKWKFLFSLGVFIASLLPFGTFYLEAKYLKKMKADPASN